MNDYDVSKYNEPGGQDDTLDEFEDLSDTYATITMCDDDGTEVEFLVISSVEDKGTTYLLVMESDLIDDDEAEATILKEVRVDGEESFFAVVEDDDEFFKAVAFFKNSNEDYDIEVN